MRSTCRSRRCWGHRSNSSLLMGGAHQHPKLAPKRLFLVVIFSPSAADQPRVQPYLWGGYIRFIRHSTGDTGGFNWDVDTF